jgi:hypothetical protein
LPQQRIAWRDSRFGIRDSGFGQIVIPAEAGISRET